MVHDVGRKRTFDGVFFCWLFGHREIVDGQAEKPLQILARRQNDSAAEAGDAADLYAKLEKILSLYHRERPRWISVMKGAIALNACYFNTQRMVQQYVANAYM